jgi:hypothetical protein
MGNLGFRSLPRFGLGGTITFSFIVYSVPLHEATSEWHFVLSFPNGNFELPKLGTPTTLGQLWGPIIWCANLWLRWGLKQSYSPHQKIFNGMSHATCTQGNWVNSWLLVVGSQIANLIPDFFWGHNLCFKCSNGSCEPILDIYVSISFQWYKKLFNIMGFNPYNHSLKI